MYHTRKIAQSVFLNGRFKSLLLFKKALTSYQNKDCGGIILSYQNLMSSMMRSPVKPLPCCPLLVSPQAPWSRWVEWPEITVLASLCSL